MNKRIFVEKKPGFDIESKKLLEELKILFPIKNLKVYQIYELFGIDEKTYKKASKEIFAPPTVDVLHEKFTSCHPFFAFEYLEGQYDKRADAAMQCLKIISPGNTTKVKTAKLIELIEAPEGALDIAKNHCINPLESKEKDLSKLEINSLIVKKTDLEIKGFLSFSLKELINFHKNQSLVIDIEDLIYIQTYFKKQKREPSTCEIDLFDTYWSDHCKHATFFTHLEKIEFKGSLQKRFEKTFTHFLHTKEKIKDSSSSITLMNLGTLAAKALYKEGKLSNWLSSKDANASTIEIEVNTQNGPQKWHVLFKNETHNRSTELEPFSGASTCLGGAIRDVLAGRAYSYQVMRISGSANPLEIKKKNKNKKLSQYKISKGAALGFSSYGNQIGISSTYANEIYHEGYRAKHMEVGMIIGAVCKDFITQKIPQIGDVILLIGGDTGKEGIGGAKNSSKIDDPNSSAQIQKGNPVIERKLQRFIRKKEVVGLIKKCANLGSGGIALGVAKLSEGIEIQLEQVHLKSNYLTPREIAFSESQERIAVVVESKDLEAIICLAKEENLKASLIAKVTDSKKLVVKYKEEILIELEKEFIESKGFINHQQLVEINSPQGASPLEKKEAFTKENFLTQLSDLNVASQRGLSELFDHSIGAGSFLMPFGGAHQLSPSEGSAIKIPTQNEYTSTLTLASYGYHPEITCWSPFHGGAYAVLESVSKIIAMGGELSQIRLNFQEYFEALGKDPLKWGKPFGALLGAYEAQCALEVGAIGGKDSMSGSFEELDVPPTLISFAIAPCDGQRVTSTELKNPGSKLYLYHHKPKSDGLPHWESIKEAYQKIQEKVPQKDVLALKTIKDGGIACALAKMAFGNGLGVSINTQIPLFDPLIGSLLIESSKELDKELGGGFVFLGEVISSPTLIINEISTNLDEALKAWDKTFEPIFPANTAKDFSFKKEINFKKVLNENVSKDIIISKKAFPRVYIPIFPGTNSEYDALWAFKKEGAKVNSGVFRNLNTQDIEESIAHFKNEIQKAQILMFPGGFSAGDEPDGSAKFIKAILHNPYIKEAIEEFLSQDKLILGICNGFQALIKSGLLPFGKIGTLTETSPTLTFNHSGHHISYVVQVKVVSDHSPWLRGMKDQIFSFPISHGEGRFYAQKEILEKLKNQNQIATQYVDLEGNLASDIPFNPNGSIGSVEGVCSPDGKVFGRMGHPERVDKDLFKNIPGLTGHNIFRNGVNYFL